MNELLHPTPGWSPSWTPGWPSRSKLLGNRWEIGAPAQPEAPLDGGSGALSWADDVPGGGGAEGI
jgi:hypothetical protein